MSHVLIVDDEPSICWGFRELLADEGYAVSVASSAEEALELTESAVPDAVVLDVRLPGRDGLSTIQDLRRRIGAAPIIVITAFGNLETAVRAMEEGAYDYLTKPFDLEQISEVLRRALKRSSTTVANMVDDRSVVPDTFIGTSPAMQSVFKQIALVAPSDVPVLITGESGTGKELVAQAIHRHSRRKDGPFLPTCLAALSPGLIESELFGHVKGAFTGADQARQGLLELADGGTVFLDEIGDVPLPVQVKLLRSIEQHEVTPVGDARARRTNFRVLAATNRPLDDLVARGEFREDLFYRLGVFHIHVPPLRERAEDIPLLARAFLRTAAAEGEAPSLSDNALRELASRRWPGNVRELRNAVERAALLARGGEIEIDHLATVMPISARVNRSVGEELQLATANWATESIATEPQRDANDPDNGDLLERFLRVVEPPLLKAALLHCGGNRAAAAKMLGIHRATLRQKLNDCGLNGD
ncbi:MAG TPA: sigma-54 dependent transcriptional regulator [Planctomycetaceae bacterium]|nr:sigma-54 dependent transcriptional regulator [Planctomycetaceae bacterium]